MLLFISANVHTASTGNAWQFSVKGLQPSGP